VSFDNWGLSALIARRVKKEGKKEKKGRKRVARPIFRRRSVMFDGWVEGKKKKGKGE